MWDTHVRASMKGEGCFIVAEAGVNHGGREDIAFALIDAAAETGADAVKFQTFRAETLVVPGAPKAAYQDGSTGPGDQFTMLKALELAPAVYERLAAHCRSRSIEFLSTPFDTGSADTLISYGMKRLKVPSGEITNFPLLRHLASKDLPIILSTGMSTLEEVKEAVAVIAEERKNLGLSDSLAHKLVVLHCTSNYPTSIEDANLRAMLTMRDALGVTVGFSDHTEGIVAALAAVALGAAVIEKHFTLDRNLPGPDHKTSLTPNEFACMVSDIRAVEKALGDGVKVPRSCELSIRDVVRRSVVLKRALIAGQKIDSEDLVLLRPGVGIAPKDVSKLVGCRVARNLPAGHVLKWDDVIQ